MQQCYEIESADGLNAFLNGGDIRKAGAITYDASARIAAGISRLGASAAVALGAYVFALRNLQGDSVKLQWPYRSGGFPQLLGARHVHR